MKTLVSTIGNPRRRWMVFRNSSADIWSCGLVWTALKNQEVQPGYSLLVIQAFWLLDISGSSKKSFYFCTILFDPSVCCRVTSWLMMSNSDTDSNSVSSITRKFGLVLNRWDLHIKKSTRDLLGVPFSNNGYNGDIGNWMRTVQMQHMRLCEYP